MICASSFVSWTRCFVFRVGLLAPLAGVLLFGLAVGAGSLLAPETALADTALFRVEQSWHNYPNPAVTTPGGAGMYQGYIQPGATPSMLGGYVNPPATAAWISSCSSWAKLSKAGAESSLTGFRGP